MAKRFTDSDKWKKKWFRDLPNDMKVFWIYICDTCNIAGVWDKDFELASFLTGNEVNESVALKYMEKQIEILPNGKWLIKDFISFQYGSLTPNNNLHKSVIQLLEISGAYEGLICPLSKGKGKGKGKDEGVVGETKIDLSWPISYLNQLLGTRYSTKGANADFVKARYSEGRTQEDFKTVIDKKVAQWRSDENMAKYLRPETLFNRKKFESYLNEPIAIKSNSLDAIRRQREEADQIVERFRQEQRGTGASKAI